MLQQKKSNSVGKKITLKDIANLKQYEENFKCLFYQDRYMQHMFEQFPEIILVDATYKLLELRLPVYLVLVIDGDGLSVVVGVMILGDETKPINESAVEAFKKYNKAWRKVEVVMSDKDFTERDASKCFPDAQLPICLYHTMRYMRREVTCEKMGITSAERSRLLELLQNMAYSFSEENYMENVEKLKCTKMKAVIDYFMENWYPIKEQWVMCFNLGETTNNRLESTFNKLRAFVRNTLPCCSFLLNFLQY